MSNPRIEGDVDSETRAAWRALARERTPASLDAAVLAEARRALATRRHQWLRPLAWAAGIGLCFAIVLQITQAPVGAPAGTDADAVHQAALESRAQKQGDLARAKAGGASDPADAREPADADLPAAQAGVAEPLRPCAQDEDRASRWLACIEALERAGDPAAVAERQRFDRAHPAPAPIAH